MADKKITDLSAVTAPADTDLLWVETDPAGSPESKKGQIDNVLRLAHGSISVTAGAGTQTPAAATWTKVTQFTAEDSAKNVTASHATDKITLTNTGRYIAIWQVTATGAADEYRLAIYWNGAIVQVPVMVKVPGTDLWGATVAVMLNATLAAADLEAYVYTVLGSVFVLKESVLHVHRIG